MTIRLYIYVQATETRRVSLRCKTITGIQDLNAVQDFNGPFRVQARGPATNGCGLRLGGFTNPQGFDAMSHRTSTVKSLACTRGRYPATAQRPTSLPRTLCLDQNHTMALACTDRCIKTLLGPTLQPQVKVFSINAQRAGPLSAICLPPPSGQYPVKYRVVTVGSNQTMKSQQVIRPSTALGTTRAEENRAPDAPENRS